MVPGSIPFPFRQGGLVKDDITRELMTLVTHISSSSKALNVSEEEKSKGRLFSQTVKDSLVHRFFNPKAEGGTEVTDAGKSDGRSRERRSEDGKANNPPSD